MALREGLVQLVAWHVGDGEGCLVFGEPWFEGALNFNPVDESQRRLCLKDLMDEQTGLWNSHLLIHLFGYQKCMYILASVQPPSPDNGPDRLVFTGSTNGSFRLRSVISSSECRGSLKTIEL